MLVMQIDVSEERTLLLTPPKLEQREHMTFAYKGYEN